MQRRQHLRWTLASCALIVWAGTQSWGFDDAPGVPVGLNELIPAEVPSDLDDDYFAGLQESIDDSWKDWTTETQELVVQFYRGDRTTIEAQQEALRKLRVKVKTIEKALADSRYRSIHGELSDLWGRLAPRVDIAEATLESLTVDQSTVRTQQFSQAKSELNSALSRFRSDMNSVRGGQPWLQWARTSQLQSVSLNNPESLEAVHQVKSKIEKREEYDENVKQFLSRDSFRNLEDALARVQVATAPPAQNPQVQFRGEIKALLTAADEYHSDPSNDSRAALRSQITALRSSPMGANSPLLDTVLQHYMNFNLRLHVSEGLLNRVAAENRRESSSINDVALGARIVGCQTSDVTVTIDVLPSDSQARFTLQSSGVVRTDTNAFAQQATIRTFGTHTFSGSKPIYFDGTRFTTGPASISVQANNQPVGARTRFSGGLFGGIANRIAMREAYSRRGQANAYTQQNIREEVAEGLNEEADERFFQTSMRLQERYGPLRKYGLYPDRMKVRSTSDAILYSTRLAGESEVAGSIPAPGVSLPSSGLVAEIHESLLSNGSNRLDLGKEGRVRMTQEELRVLLQERLEEILGRDVEFKTPEGESRNDVFVFDQPDPIQFEIEEGSIIMKIRTGLEREGDDPIPPQNISVTLTPELTENKIILKRGRVRVVDAGVGGGTAREKIIRSRIMISKFEEVINDREFDREVEVDVEGKTIILNVSDIIAENGWLTVVLR